MILKPGDPEKRPWALILTAFMEFFVIVAASITTQKMQVNFTLTVAVVASLLFLFTIGWLVVLLVINRRRRRMEGQAYIFFKARPPHSQTLALELSKQPEVLYAAVVWGVWDIIARVATASAADLVQFLKKIQTSFGDVLRTETYFIRSDQCLESTSQPAGTKWSFLFLKVEAQSITAVLENLRSLTSKPNEFTQILHAAGILGPYDIGVTVKHFKDTQLSKLVMDDIQRKNGVTETVVLPSIEEMVFQKGRIVG